MGRRHCDVFFTHRTYLRRQSMNVNNFLNYCVSIIIFKRDYSSSREALNRLSTLKEKNHTICRSQTMQNFLDLKDLKYENKWSLRSCELKIIFRETKHLSFPLREKLHYIYRVLKRTK